MREIVLDYPHSKASREALPLCAEAVWRVAEGARQLICLHPRRPKVEVGSLIARAQRFRVNGVSFRARWEYSDEVLDETGRAVLGAIGHDGRDPETATIELNTKAIGSHQELARSTALHELGHAVFDAPSWVINARQISVPSATLARRHFLPARSHHWEPRPGKDWPEWRANEFMGAFLAPRTLVHQELVKRAASLGLPMLAQSGTRLPLVNGAKTESGGLDVLSMDLAETFGLSNGFMAVRLRKYGLVRGGWTA
jgi:hypothetical protein